MTQTQTAFQKSRQMELGGKPAPMQRYARQRRPLAASSGGGQSVRPGAVVRTATGQVEAAEGI